MKYVIIVLIAGGFAACKPKEMSSVANSPASLNQYQNAYSLGYFCRLLDDKNQEIDEKHQMTRNRNIVAGSPVKSFDEKFSLTLDGGSIVVDFDPQDPVLSSRRLSISVAQEGRKGMGTLSLEKPKFEMAIIRSNGANYVNCEVVKAVSGVPTVISDQPQSTLTVKSDQPQATPTVISDQPQARPTVKSDQPQARPTVKSDQPQARPTVISDQLQSTPTVISNPPD